MKFEEWWENERGSGGDMLLAKAAWNAALVSATKSVLDVNDRCDDMARDAKSDAIENINKLICGLE